MTRFTITLEPSADRLNREPIMRLKGALKVLGRGFALRCVSIIQEPPSDPRTRASEEQEAPE